MRKPTPVTQTPVISIPTKAIGAIAKWASTDKRSTSLRRSTPLRRKSWMKARGDTKYRRRPRFLDYMMWIKREPCCARAVGYLVSAPCRGRVEADHAGKRVTGQKADDRTCIPLCQRHHQDRNDFQGAFRAFKHDQMRAWLDQMIDQHQILYLESLGREHAETVQQFMEFRVAWLGQRTS